MLSVPSQRKDCFIWTGSGSFMLYLVVFFVFFEYSGTLCFVFNLLSILSIAVFSHQDACTVERNENPTE